MRITNWYGAPEVWLYRCTFELPILLLILSNNGIDVKHIFTVFYTGIIGQLWRLYFWDKNCGGHNFAQSGRPNIFVLTTFSVASDAKLITVINLMFESVRLNALIQPNNWNFTKVVISYKNHDTEKCLHYFLLTFSKYISFLLSKWLQEICITLCDVYQIWFQLYALWYQYAWCVDLDKIIFRCNY